MSNKTKAVIAIVLSAFLWSAAGTTTKILYRSFDPFPLAFIRFFIAFLVILPIFLKQKNINLIDSVKNLFPIAIFSSGNILFYYLGLSKTTVIASTIIYSVTPLVVALLAKFLIKEIPTLNKLIGIIIGFVGVLIISVWPLLQQNQSVASTVLGNLLIFIAVFSWSIYTVGSKHFLNDNLYSPISLSTVSFFCSTIIFGILTFLIPHKDILHPLLNLSNILLIAYLSILMTVVVFLLFQWAVKYSSATVASLNQYLQPVFGVALAMIILNEKFMVEYLIGSALIFIGLVITANIKIWKLKT